MHEVIHQPRVAAHRDALARRVQVGFGRNRVLIIAEIIANISQHLDERDAEVWHVALGPVGDEQCQAIENELAKTCVVFREVINLRLIALFWWAN